MEGNVEKKLKKKKKIFCSLFPFQVRTSLKRKLRENMVVFFAIPNENKNM